VQWLLDSCRLSMALHLYRSHNRECEAGRAKDSRSGELDERRKGVEALPLRHPFVWNAGGEVQQARHPALDLGRRARVRFRA
jgi:hypothetical protein